MSLLPPDDALRFFDDEALFGEIRRRLDAARRLIPKETNTWELGASMFVEVSDEESPVRPLGVAARSPKDKRPKED